MAKIKIYAMAAIMGLMTMLTACDDRLDFDIDPVIPGETTVTVELGYSEFAAALDSRSDGDLLNSINTLWIVIYNNEDGELYDKVKVTDLTRQEQDHTPDGGSVHAASCKLTMPSGKYRMYAVANMDLTKKDVATEDKLKSIRASWNEALIRENGEMFGRVQNADSESSTEYVTIDKNHTTLHAWMRRLASKVTVAFDGSKLKPGVTVYIKSVAVKDIPRSCPLFDPNSPVTADSLIATGEVVRYSPNEAYDDNYPAYLNNSPEHSYFPAKEKSDGSGWEIDPEAHDDKAWGTLFFYENLQGKGEEGTASDKRQVVSEASDKTKPSFPNGNTKPDGTEATDPTNTGFKDAKPYGSYIEVDAYYFSTNEEKRGSGTIKYRFMLGKDIITDYDAERNHHYKLTLHLKNFANDIDWHVDYSKQILTVTQPRVFNYQGQVFDADYRVPNLGHNFSNQNKITVTSYYDQENMPFAEYKVEYMEEGSSTWSNTPPHWLKYEVADYESSNPKKIVTFTVDTNYHKDLDPTDLRQPYVYIDIDERMQSKSEIGSAAAPFNLANPEEGEVAPSSATAYNTGNCYMVSSPGWYLLPLVYGNAIHKGENNVSAYKYQGASKGDNILVTFKNHLGNGIVNPYIIDNDGCKTPTKVTTIWQDELGLVDTPSDWEDKTDAKFGTYIPNAYGNKGGIRIHLPKASFKQGNAVIGIKNDVDSVMWSWHIWATDLSGFDETIKVMGNDTTRQFKMMPVNIGWCSPHGAKIRYYKRRTCQVKFSTAKIDDKSQERIITIVKESHTAYPRGNNIYYQWGRKDPFIGYVGSTSTADKLRYDWHNWSVSGRPSLLSPSNSDNDKRFTTRKALHLMICNPDKWHNPPRKLKPGMTSSDTNPWASYNETYANLWEGRTSSDPNAPTLKTIYDPSPIGYQITHFNAFTGFTSLGDNTNEEDYWYDVKVDNVAKGNPVDSLYEFYTDHSKVKSIIFPVTGYRDWDSDAMCYKFGFIGYVWSAGNRLNDDNNSYNFEFARKDDSDVSYVRPKNYFYPCDGFPVRPCVY